MGLCFCPACIKRANSSHFDIRSVQRFTKQTLESWFADPIKGAEQSPSFDKLPPDIIEPMLAWRKTVVSSLMEEVAAGSKGTKLRQLVSIDPAARELVGVDAASSANSTGGILALGTSGMAPLYANR